MVERRDDLSQTNLHEVRLNPITRASSIKEIESFEYTILE